MYYVIKLCLPTTNIVKLNPLLLDVVPSELYNENNNYGIITDNVISEIVVEGDVQKLSRGCH